MSLIAGFFVPHPPLIVPEVGRGEERTIARTIDAYKDVAKRIRELNPNTIILTSPHAPAYHDWFHLSEDPIATGSLVRFGAPQVQASIRSDAAIVRAIVRQAQLDDLPVGPVRHAGSELDHGSLVPLYFLGDLTNRVRFVRLSPSGLPLSEHYQIGRMVAGVLPEDKRVVWLASGDLSHTLKADGPYGKTEEGPLLDQRFTEMIEAGDLDAMLDWDPGFCEKAAVCGLGSFAMMAGAFEGCDVESELLSYEGPFGVGYAVASFLIKGLSKDSNEAMDEDPYVRLARQSLTHHLLHGGVMDVPSDLPPELISERHGAFVSIHAHGALRGCIGTIHPTQESLAEEIIHNAIASGTRDYRFRPITKRELKDLTFHVDVLLPPEAISSKEELDVKRYGVIVRKGFHSGLLLPNLEGIDTVEEQIDIACRKAGISPNDSYRMERFEVIRHET